MYQYVFASVFYCNIDGNNFKLSVHRNPRLIKFHSVIAPLYQPIKFSSKTNWILVTLLWYLFSLWQCSEIVGRIQHHGRESKGQKMIRDFPWAQCIINIIIKKTKQNKTKQKEFKNTLRKNLHDSQDYFGFSEYRQKGSVWILVLIHSW